MVAILGAGCLLFPGAGLAQGRPQTATSPPQTQETPTTAWSFSGMAYFYYLPDDDFFGIPIVYADHSHLHLEARYNYEDFATTSLFGGWKFEFGENVLWELTPILGVVAGNTDGIAPGLETSISWKKLEFYSESEYLLDRQGRDGDFYYNWTEVSYVPTDWIRAGLVAQRTKRFETDLDIQRGFLIGSSYRNFSYTFYLLNPFEDDVILVLGLTAEF